MSHCDDRNVRDFRDLHDSNRASWNAVTPAHNSHKVDQAAFFAAGGSTLFSDEVELLGDLRGKDLVHLQCNCGQDSLSLAALGARVLGVDISDEAIAFARKLGHDSGIDAQFERADLFDWFDANAQSERRFDLAFASYGTIGWLASVQRWARGAADALQPGGRLVLLEFHPLVWSLGPNAGPADSYFLDKPLFEAGVGDYVGRSGEGLTPSGWSPGIEAFENPKPSVSFQWTVAQIVQAVIDAGLLLETLREYPYANGCALFETMRALPGRRYAMPKGSPDMPLMLGLVARKPQGEPREHPAS